MPNPTEDRAALLAVSRFGADSVKVQQAIQAVLQSRRQGKAADLLDYLLKEKLLNESQVQELRVDLDRTQLAGPPLGAKNSGDGLSPVGEENQPSANGAVNIPPTSSGHHLRTLGEYRLLRRLGEGGMGSVYLAYKGSENQQFALKVLSDQLVGNQAYLDRFHREAKSGSLLNHPNIVRCFAAGRDPTSRKHYLAMEFVDGPSAHHLLDKMGRLPVGDVVHIALDIARALEYLHTRNFVHRDIKPDNILITQAGVAKLADLGLAKRMDDASPLTATHQAFGTPYYMPYEQAINAKKADSRSDIFALGATLYHLLTGEVPFKGNSPGEVAERKMEGDFIPAHVINPEVPPLLDGILARMMARNPRDRFQTASDLIVQLERSNLAASLPSFVELSQALADPLMRARLTAPSEATQPDLEAASRRKLPSQPGVPENLQAAKDADIWYLRFRDAQGQWCKSRGTPKQIVDRFHGGLIPKDVEVSRRPEGEFKSLSEFPEFREAINAAGSQPKLAPEEKKRVRGRRFLRSAFSSGSMPFLPASFWLVVAILLLTAVGVAIFLVVNQ
jgi:serine/threonine-protein kinase